MMPFSGSSRPNPRAGIISVPRSINRISITVKASGIAPPESKNKTEGTASGMFEFKI